MTYKDKFRQRLVAAQPEEILDVGCGEGALLQYCEALGISAIGVDPDQDAIAECQRKGLRAICGGAEHLDLPDNSVDFVASEFSLH
ncbi:MAG: class I SAM-dependent methyltransferase, partial [Pseudomonadota bacterium]